MMSGGRVEGERRSRKGCFHHFLLLWFVLSFLFVFIIVIAARREWLLLLLLFLMLLLLLPLWLLLLITATDYCHSRLTHSLCLSVCHSQSVSQSVRQSDWLLLLSFIQFQLINRFNFVSVILLILTHFAFRSKRAMFKFWNAAYDNHGPSELCTCSMRPFASLRQKAELIILLKYYFIMLYFKI